MARPLRIFAVGERLLSGTVVSPERVPMPSGKVMGVRVRCAHCRREFSLYLSNINMQRSCGCMKKSDPNYVLRRPERAYEYRLRRRRGRPEEKAPGKAQVQRRTERAAALRRASRLTAVHGQILDRDFIIEMLSSPGVLDEIVREGAKVKAKREKADRARKARNARLRRAKIRNSSEED